MLLPLVLSIWGGVDPNLTSASEAEVTTTKGGAAAWPSSVAPTWARARRIA